MLRNLVLKKLILLTWGYWPLRMKKPYLTFLWGCLEVAKVPVALLQNKRDHLSLPPVLSSNGSGPKKSSLSPNRCRDLPALLTTVPVHLAPPLQGQAAWPNEERSREASWLANPGCAQITPCPAHWDFLTESVFCAWIPLPLGPLFSVCHVNSLLWVCLHKAKRCNHNRNKNKSS